MKQLTTLLFCLFTLSVFGQTQSLTLEEAIDHAMKHNAEVKNASLIG